MIGLVIITHADLGEGLLAAATMIVGRQEGVTTLCIGREDSVEEIRERLQQAIQDVGRHGAGGVIVMTDMFGGTPSNISLAFLEPERVEILSGINLPMVLKFFNSRDALGLVELAILLKQYGQQGITLASEFLQKK